jgi:hypothetical protein
VEPDNASGLSLLLDQFLAKEPSSKTQSYEQAKTKPLSSGAKDLVRHLKNLGVKATHGEFENIRAEAFRDSGIQTLAEPKSGDSKYDFALWLDELQHLLV